jgi:asparagine synthase (glutamine-hydrolysing)
MCGIAATYSYRGGQIDQIALGRTCDRMWSRGPDGDGLWISPDGRAGLGHRRLSIIDLSSAGAQPMHSADGRFSIVFNGEIYNYRQLRASLEQKGVSFRSHSDTEVLLASFATDGPESFSRLRGMFAVAIWDSERHVLTVARDPYGIKPLYIADTGRRVSVASQVKALLAGGDIDTTPEPAGHAGFFLWGHVPEPYTLYRGIHALPPGHTQEFGPEGASTPVSFGDVVGTMAAAEAAPERLNGTADRYIREQLLDSVRHHLVADVDVGVFLSSGLDSTTLAALSAEVGGSLKTLTLGFEEFRGTPNDEVPLAEAVARAYDAEHETVWITRKEFSDHLDRMLDAMDQPSTDGVNSYFVSLAARKAGLKVALSGLGGDELFGGYPSFTEIPRFARMTPHVPSFGRVARRLSAPLVSRLTSPKYASILEYGGTYGGGYLLRRGHFMPWELPSILPTDVAREGLGSLDPIASLNRTDRGLHHPHLRVAALESTWYMRNQLLRDTDWASMAHSLEVRVPLVDMTLLSRVAPLIAAGVPVSKRMMASAPQKPLPDAVLNRPKSGFFVPVRTWMLEGRHGTTADRGLRGWARFVYEHFTA